ncbi:hypothetical protein [Streptosporangium sp. NPDC002721]|uniref:hypothetical protein n=1 Tax=Streptosporangium sp. NPDC002721 TaxID=3366188 RepID=UPI00367A91E8
MFKPPIAVTLALLSVLLVSGRADALTYPVRGVPVLTDNGLYRGGEIKPSKCPGGALSIESTAAAKRTLAALWRCLNTSWSAHAKRARLPFAPARLVVLTKPARFCGKSWSKDLIARYCPATKTAAILVNDKYYLRTREIYHFQHVAGIYGTHLQHVNGMERGFEALPSRNQAERFEKERRWSLQARCLGGVFLGSVWETAGEGSEGWPALLELVKANGDHNSKTRRHFGKGGNIVHWLDRGFRSGDPGSCNTWKASSARVA